MDPVTVKYAELHNPLFLGGKNFGLKLDPSKLNGLSLSYDYSKEQLLVKWNKTEDIARVHKPNVAYHIEGEVKIRAEINMAHPMVANIGAAQVETPMSHVHSGPGKGKTK